MSFICAEHIQNTQHVKVQNSSSRVEVWLNLVDLHFVLLLLHLMFLRDV